MKLRGNKIPRFFVKYSHWEHRKLRCFFFSALGFGISSFLPWKKANRRIASTASEYPLADFALFRSPARTVKIACWGAGLRWKPQSVKRFEAPTEPTGETSQTLMRNGGENSCSFLIFIYFNCYLFKFLSIHLCIWLSILK